MKKSTKKPATKKVAKKVVSKSKKSKLKFDFAELVKTSTDGAKGSIFAKILGPEYWNPKDGTMKHQPLDLDYAQLYKPNDSDLALLTPGEAWVEFTFKKVLYSIIPDEFVEDDDYDLL